MRFVPDGWGKNQLRVTHAKVTRKGYTRKDVITHGFSEGLSEIGR